MYGFHSDDDVRSRRDINTGGFPRWAASLRVTGLLSCVLLLAGCVTPQYPDSQVAAKMSLDDAEKTVQHWVHWYSGVRGVYYQQRWKFTVDRIAYYRYDTKNGKVDSYRTCSYESFNPYFLADHWAYSEAFLARAPLSYAVSPGCPGAGLSEASWLYVPTPEAANEMTTALQRWKISTPSERRAWLSQKEQKFAVAAEQYRMADPKPALPEEARRFKVIAESAVRDKRFSDAANAYEDGLKLVPGWPEGQFNAALMLGELRYYDEAIDRMKKYLALVPNAPNARAAQDKIYAWEGARESMKP